MENNGVFVCRTRHLLVAGGKLINAGAGAVKVPQSPRRGSTEAKSQYFLFLPQFSVVLIFLVSALPVRSLDIVEGNGAISNGAAQAPTGRRPRRDPLLHKTVRIKQGPHKGLLGIVTDVAPKHVRIELHTNCKTLTIPLEYIKVSAFG